MGPDTADNLFDLKKFIPGEGSGKEFLKTEVERMIGILRKKQDVGGGVHTFRRMEFLPLGQVKPGSH